MMLLMGWKNEVIENLAAGYGAVLAKDGVN
jgi:hypothetical protein